MIGVGTGGTSASITLATLPHATAQDVFSQVARHLLTQNATSYGPRATACAYRGEYGMRCAAGCLIGDDEWVYEEMEGMPWGQLVHRGVVPMAHQGLIRQLQLIHDEFPPAKWHELLTNLAQALHLQMPEVTR